ncbi:hypothetical protein ABT160_35930 [Streptomyces sp. NPDC001941]|uniref:hypothetical protein n=1 Tax=Streptomyces sp. NPDC001941 TaxID=3154659 RepID=UPI00331EC8CE
MTKTSKIRAALGVAAAALLTTGALAAPAAAYDAPAPTTQQTTSTPAAGAHWLVGSWAERVDKSRPGITFYTSKLTFTRDGRFTLVPGVQCNDRICPQFKLALNQGTYRVTGRTIHLKGNLGTLRGRALCHDVIAVDDHYLERTRGR